MRWRRSIGIAALVALLAACQSGPTDVRPESPAAIEAPAPRPAAVPATATPAPADADTAPAVQTPPERVPEPPSRLTNGDEVFQTIRRNLQAPVCAGGGLPERWRQRIARHPDAVARQLQTALPLLAYVVESLEEVGLPSEFAFIPLIESGYRPNARGIGGPVGLWQMVPSTARAHGVRVTRGHDGRLSVVEATAGAIDHLRQLQAEFGDWRATAIAYNAGLGSARRAFVRAGNRTVEVSQRQPPGLSGITYAYVAKLDAWACLISHPEQHGLSLPTAAFTPFNANSAPAITATTDNAEHPGEYVVVEGDTLWRIAHRYGTTIAALQQTNGLGRRSVLRVGQRLRIPR